MTSRRQRANLAIEVAALVLGVGAVDLVFFRSDLSVGASLLLFGGEVVVGAIAWIAASRLLEGRIRWGVFESRPIDRRGAFATVIGVSAFFVLLAASSLAFGWRSMSLVPIVTIGLLVWWLLAEPLERGASHDETRRLRTRSRWSRCRRQPRWPNEDA